VLVSTGRDLSAQVRAPRTVFVNFPMGNTFGKPFDASEQRRILRDALMALESFTTGGEILDLPYRWHEEFAMNLGSGYQSKGD
jgi:D-proline reductase (dithiol) PrdB